MIPIFIWTKRTSTLTAGILDHFLHPCTIFFRCIVITGILSIWVHNIPRVLMQLFVNLQMILFCCRLLRCRLLIILSGLPAGSILMILVGFLRLQLKVWSSRLPWNVHCSPGRLPARMILMLCVVPMFHLIWFRGEHEFQISLVLSRSAPCGFPSACRSPWLPTGIHYAAAAAASVVLISWFCGKHLLHFYTTVYSMCVAAAQFTIRYVSSSVFYCVRSIIPLSTTLLGALSLRRRR